MAESIGAMQPLRRVAAWQPPFQLCGELEVQTSVPQRSSRYSLDPDVVGALRASGPGWQTRVNTILKEWLATHPAKS